MLFSPLISAQEQYHSPCTQIDTFHSLCQFACTLCDIDGFSKWTEQYVWGESGGVTIPVGGCGPDGGGGKDLFSFVALSSELTIKITLPECVNVNGPQAIERDFSVEGFYSTTDACLDELSGFNFDIVSIFPCSDDDFIIQVGESKEFASNVPLTIGGTYYLQLGTSGATQCLYEIEVIEGSTAVPVLNPPRLSNIGPVCAGETVSYKAQDTLPLTQYAITLNGDTLSTQYSTEISWLQPGNFELCLYQRNPCDVQDPMCYQITVFDPPAIDTTVFLCPDSCLNILDSTLCAAGNYAYAFIDANGCQSIANVQVIPYSNDTTVLFAQVCEGDTLYYQGDTYFATGSYNRILSNRNGCDSLVSLDIIVDFCPLDIESDHQNILCHGDDNGQVTVSIQSGLSPYNYVFRQLGGMVIANGTINGSAITTFSGLLSGTYLLEVIDQAGNEGFININVVQPDPLITEVQLSDYLGTSISCFGANDGRIALTGQGGVGPYQYRLNQENFTTNSLFDQLSANVYSYTLEDANGCRFERSIELLQPQPLVGDFIVDDEDCISERTGMAFNLGSNGGTGNYSEILSDLNTGEIISPPYDSLIASTYLLTVGDENGCIFKDTLIVESPQRATLELQIGQSLAPQGEEREISVLTESNSAIFWNSPYDSICPGCPLLSVIPVEDTWLSAIVISPDGCTASDSILIDTYPVSDVYLPSAFSPNDDGINDHLLIFPGHTVTSVTFKVFDRWGTEVFFSTDGIRNGWDGNVKDKKASPGVYAYSTVVQYLDGRTKHFAKEVVLIR